MATNFEISILVNDSQILSLRLKLYVVKVRNLKYNIGVIDVLYIAYQWYIINTYGSRSKSLIVPWHYDRKWHR